MAHSQRACGTALQQDGTGIGSCSKVCGHLRQLQILQRLALLLQLTLEHMPELCFLHRGDGNGAPEAVMARKKQHRMVPKMGSETLGQGRAVAITGHSMVCSGCSI